MSTRGESATAGHSPRAGASPRTRPVRVSDVQEKASQYLGPDDLALIQRAYVFTAKAHEGQSRRSGEPYLIHPLAVAEILAGQRMDATTVVSGFLHDVIEDTSVTSEEIEELFGGDVRKVVDGVTKLGKLSFSTKEQVQAESFRKMLLATAQDLRVILVKLADRLHNMRTLEHLPDPKRQRVSRETMDIYMPIAHRLGMGRLKQELEELAFRHGQPERYQALADQLEARGKVEKGFVARTEKRLAELLDERGIEADINGRRKTLASIDRKLKVTHIGLDEVYDYLAFRIITSSVEDCYAVLGLIHAKWTPVQSRIKDFIATPKPNGYRSLHTTVSDELGQLFEIQIRTEDMHLVAEEGVAAHWGYKAGTALSAEEAGRFAWLRDLLDAQADLTDPEEFMQAVKLDLYADQVFCHTPKGEVKVLPVGATAIDFAYAIHTEVGHTCNGAKIDGKIVPLRTPLQHGCRVEILTGAGGPSRDWLDHVATSRARSKIRAWFHARERTETIEKGRQLLDVTARKHGLSAKGLLGSTEGRTALSDLGYRDAEDLLHALGREKLAARTLLAKARPDLVADETPSEDVVRARIKRTGKRSSGRGSGPVVAGEEGLLTNLAKCCRPLRGEPVVGYVTRGRGVTVHRADCRSRPRTDSGTGRLVDVTWGRGGDRFEVPLRVIVDDRKGILGEVTGAISSLEIDISSASAKRRRRGRRGQIELVVDVVDVDELSRVIRALNAVEGVVSVVR